MKCIHGVLLAYVSIFIAVFINLFYLPTETFIVPILIMGIGIYYVICGEVDI